jgi:hypothetical protein
MRRKVLLSSLTVGRCFTVPVDDDGSGTAETDDKAVVARAVMSAENVWKVTAAGDAVSAENANGECSSFDAALPVLEIPRQGYDRMVERAG